MDEFPESADEFAGSDAEAQPIGPIGPLPTAPPVDPLPTTLAPPVARPMPTALAPPVARPMPTTLAPPVARPTLPVARPALPQPMPKQLFPPRPFQPALEALPELDDLELEEEIEIEIEGEDLPEVEDTSGSKRYAQAAVLDKLQDDSENDMLAQMGIKTCKEIRDFVESSNMDKESKVLFIKQNMKDTKTLKSFVKKMNLTPNQMKLTTLSANEILSHVKDQVKNMFLDRPANMTDMEIEEEADCAYLQKYLDEHYANVPSKWGMITGTIGYCLNALKTMTVAVWNKLDPLGHVWMLLAWCIKSGISMWKMIIENPKTAYWTLCAIKVGKTRMCGVMADIMKSMGCAPNEYAIFKWLERKFPGKKFTAQTMMSVFLKDVVKPRLQEYLITFAGKIIQNSASTLKSVVKTVGAPALGAGVGTTLVSVGAMAAPATGGGSLVVAGIGTAIVIVFESLCDMVVAESDEDVERAKFMLYLHKCMDMFVDVFNPLNCVSQMVGSSEQDLTLRNQIHAEGYKYVSKQINQGAVPVDNPTYAAYAPYAKEIQDLYNKMEFAEAESSLEVYKKNEDKLKLLTGIACLQNYAAEDRWIQVAVYAYVSSRFYVKSLLEGTLKTVTFQTDPTIAIDWKDAALFGEIATIPEEQYRAHLLKGERLGKTALTMNIKSAWQFEWDQKRKEWETSPTYTVELELDNDVLFFIFAVSVDPMTLPTSSYTSFNPLLKNSDVMSQYYLKAWAIQWLTNVVHLVRNGQGNPLLLEKLADPKYYKRVHEDWVLNCVRFYVENAALDTAILAELDRMAAILGYCDVAKLMENTEDKAWFVKNGFGDPAVAALYNKGMSCKTPHMWQKIVETKYPYKALTEANVKEAMEQAKKTDKTGIFNRSTMQQQRDATARRDLRHKAGEGILRQLEAKQIQTFDKALAARPEVAADFLKEMKSDKAQLLEQGTQTYRDLSRLEQEYKKEDLSSLRLAIHKAVEDVSDGNKQAAAVRDYDLFMKTVPKTGFINDYLFYVNGKKGWFGGRKTFKNKGPPIGNGEATTHRRHKRVGETRRRNRRVKARRQGARQSKKRALQTTHRGHERPKFGRDRSHRR